MAMTIVWAVAGVVVGLVVLAVVAGVVLTLMGKRIPVEHEATSVIDLRCAPEKAFALIEDVAAQPAWDRNVTKVEPLQDHSGMPAARVHQGRNAFVLVRTRYEPPRVIERTITDDHGPFSGTWLYTITPNPAGCEVRLKEIGRVGIPLARAVMKHFTGYHHYVNKHLRAMGKKLGASGPPRKA